MAGEDTGQTRQLRRERVLTTKAAEQDKRGARAWSDSDEDYVEGAIEEQLEVLKAPRPNRMHNRPATPSQAAKRGRPRGA